MAMRSEICQKAHQHLRQSVCWLNHHLCSKQAERTRWTEPQCPFGRLTSSNQLISKHSRSAMRARCSMTQRLLSVIPKMLQISLLGKSSISRNMKTSATRGDNFGQKRPIGKSADHGIESTHNGGGARRSPARVYAVLLWSKQFYHYITRDWKAIRWRRSFRVGSQVSSCRTRMAGDRVTGMLKNTVPTPLA
jgi:hypothetical protein